MQQIPAVSAGWRSCWHTHVMSFSSRTGNLVVVLPFQCLDKCLWQRRAEQAGQKEWGAAKSPSAEAATLLLAACWIPSPSPESPFRVAHATFFMSSWAGVEPQHPSIAVLKGSSQGVFRQQKKTLPMNSVSRSKTNLSAPLWLRGAPTA